MCKKYWVCSYLRVSQESDTTRSLSKGIYWDKRTEYIHAVSYLHTRKPVTSSGWTKAKTRKQTSLNSLTKHKTHTLKTCCHTPTTYYYTKYIQSVNIYKINYLQILAANETKGADQASSQDDSKLKNPKYPSQQIMGQTKQAQSSQLSFVTY